jgi:hypothetical protein
LNPLYNNPKNQIAKRPVKMHGWKHFRADVSNYYVG